MQHGGCRQKQCSVSPLPLALCLGAGCSLAPLPLVPKSCMCDAKASLQQLQPSSLFLAQIAMGIPLHRIKDIRMLYGESPWGDTPICFNSPANPPVPRGHVIAARITSENPEEVSLGDRETRCPPQWDSTDGNSAHGVDETFIKHRGVPPSSYLHVHGFQDFFLNAFCSLFRVSSPAQGRCRN